MTGTGLDHPLVRDYLRELDAALAPLPADRAAELREQIAAHLDEALGPGADDREVAAALGRLGSPAGLAAEAGAAAADAGSPAQQPATFASLARRRLAGVRARTWVAMAVATVLIGSGIGYLANYLAIGNLQFAGQAGWWYPRDYNREVDTTADGASQTTVPIRSGQEQAFAVGIANPTSWTQTILGAAAGEISPGSPTMQIGVSVFNMNIDHGGFERDVRFTLPGSIPPGQIRLLRVSWISSTCLEQGGGQGIDQLTLRVRVGWFTRTETIPLDEGWFLSGPSHGSCG